MSVSSKRGKDFELEIAKQLQKKLGARVIRDPRSGAGSHHKTDIKDWHRDIPLDIEAKDHATIKPKEWMRQAEAAASMGRIPTLVFRMDGKAYAMLPFDDLVNLIVEIKDTEAALADLRQPGKALSAAKRKQSLRRAVKGAEADIEPVVQEKRKAGAAACPNGHIADQYGYCMDKHCKFARGYRPPKGKK